MRMRNLGFQQRVFVAGAFSLTLTLGVLAFVAWNLKRMSAVQGEIVYTQELIKRMNRISEYMVELETGERGYILSGGEDAYLEPYNKAEAEFENYVRATDAFAAVDPALKSRIEKIASFKREWIEGPAVQEMMAHRKYKAGRLNQEEFTAIFRGSQGKSLVEGLHKEVESIVKDKENRLNELRAENTRQTGMILLMTGLMVLAVFLGFGIILAAARSAGKAVRRLIESLGQATQQIQGAAAQAHGTSSELTSANEIQSRSLEQTASSVEQINAMVAKNAASAEGAKTLAAESREAANRGRGSVINMHRSIGDIQECYKNISAQIDESHGQIGGIVKLITEIGDKTKVINDIVFQTKLLSFNASVEAARASEHGKGFAVVAEEVGKLAQMSGEAANEISTLLSSSIGKVQDIINETKRRVEALMQEGRGRIEAGSTISGACAQALDEISGKVDQLDGMVAEISTATREQAAGINEIANAMNQLEAVNRQNVQSSDHAAQSASELGRQAEFLREVVQELQLTFVGQEAESIKKLEEADPETGIFLKIA